MADFKAKLESYFIAGAARIDLIAKIIDLDNDIGGYNFDIPLLSETERAIKDVGKPAGTKTKISRKSTLGTKHCCLLTGGASLLCDVLDSYM